MSKKRTPKTSKGALAGRTPVTPASAKQRRELDQRSKRLYDRLRRRYPELHGKVVDFITHSIEDGTLYLGIRFRDKTDFSLRYTCGMFVVGADLCDISTGDYENIREYIKPIPT